MSDERPTSGPGEFSAAEVGALAHLYRGEVYRSTVWRTRLDTTTNWAVVTLGVALSLTFAAPDASPLPLVLVGVLIILFLALEARRYRYFNVWRARTRWMERHFFVPMLDQGRLGDATEWRKVLAADYRDPQYHVSFLTAMARRVRSNYLWILLVQALAYAGKIVVHPTPAASFEEAVDRAAISPVPGLLMLALGATYVLAWVGLALWVTGADRRRAARLGDEPPQG